MAVDPNKLVQDLRALYPAELLERYATGERDFHGINLLRAELEGLASEIGPYPGLPQPVFPSSYWRYEVNPLWVDRRTPWEPIFHWEGDEFSCLLEDSWEEQEEWPEVAVKDLSGADLSDINLQGAYLYRVNFSGGRLLRAKLQGAILVEVDLSGATLERADLREARAIGVKLAGANLYLARLQRAALQRADLSQASLGRARLRRANLAFTTWQGANLHLARFSRNNLMGADFRGLDLTDVCLSDAAIYGSMITPEQESSFLDALEITRDSDAPHRKYLSLPTP